MADIIETLAQAERRLIVRALNKTKGKMKEAHKLLAPSGIPSSRNIYLKLTTYKIEADANGIYS